MRIKFLFVIFSILFTFSSLMAQVNAHLDRKVAIYLSEPTTYSNYQADLSSVKQIAAVAGFPYTITSDFNECLSYGFILFANTVDENSLTLAQESLLFNFVENGGSIVFAGLSDPELLNFAGIEYAEILTSRHYMFFLTPHLHDELRWIDDRYEKEIKLGSVSHGDIYATYGYELADAEALGQYRDSDIGFTKVNRGEGLIYTLGFAWRDLVIRNLLNRDYNATRIHEGLFDVTADVIMLLARGMYAKAIPNAVWISPAPYDSKAVLLITHDICSHTAHLFSNDFAQMEYERGISAMYNITTHQFIDDINGDNYTSHIPQMQLLLHKNHVIGSHSYGHFPDFDKGDVFPIGEKLTSLSGYNPHFSKEENRTIGGTVYGELGVSKLLLEADLNTEILMHRSGHLAVNPEQYNILDELGFIYSSSYTARNILTSFPFFTHYNQGMNDRTLPIVEIPITISDVFGSYLGDPMDEFNWMDKAEFWVEVTEKYANNNAPSNILVHPNRSYKLSAQEYFLDNMSQDIYPQEFTSYIEFWKEKNTLQFSSEVINNTLKIYLENRFLDDDQFSLVVDQLSDIDHIEVYTEDGDLQSFYSKDYYLGTGLLYQKSFVDVMNKNTVFVDNDQILFQNYPNPFAHYTTIEYHLDYQADVSIRVYDIYGRLIEELVNKQHDAGVYKVEYAAKGLPKGIYFYRLNVFSNGSYSMLTKKMIIN